MTGRIEALCGLALLFGVAVTGPARADAPDFSSIPYASEEIKERIYRDYDKARNKDNYAAAVSPSGQHWDAQYSTGSWSDNDVARNALQKCEHRAGEPCVLVAKSGRLTADGAGNFPEPTPVMSYPTSFDPDKVPFVGAADISKWMWKYYNASNSRALALTRNGGNYYVSGRASHEEAVADALKGCQKGERRRPCFIYAINGDVVFSIDTDISNRIRPE